MYRDSKLGLCLDLVSQHGNVFWLWGHARNIDKQLGRDSAIYHHHLKLAHEYGQELGSTHDGYTMAVAVFQHHYPMVTLLNIEEATHGRLLDTAVPRRTRYRKDGVRDDC